MSHLGWAYMHDRGSLLYITDTMQKELELMNKPLPSTRPPEPGVVQPGL
jgi:hypothetical protein